MTIRTRSTLLICALGLLSLCPRPAAAYFERLVISTRTFSLGGAFVAVADDPAAIILNPAGLAQLRSASFLSTIGSPYDVSDLEEYYLASAFPTRIGAFGLSWHRFAIDEVTSEDLFTIAFGHDYIRTSQDASLSFGASIDISRVAYQTPLSTSQTVISGGLSVLLRPFPIIGIGYNVRNLGQPTFDLITGGGGTQLKATHTIGLAYHWRRTVVLTYESERQQDSQWRDRVGIEVRAGDTLRFRSGINNGNVAAGFGVDWKGVSVDVGASAHDALGLSYLLSIGYSLPAPERFGGEW